MKTALALVGGVYVVVTIARLYAKGVKSYYRDLYDKKEEALKAQLAPAA